MKIAGSWYDCRMVFENFPVELGEWKNADVRFMNYGNVEHLLKIGEAYPIWEGKEVGAAVLEAFPAMSGREQIGKLLSKEEQVRALLDGSINELLARHLPEPVVDFRPYLSIRGDDVRGYLNRNKGEAEKYFRRMTARLENFQETIRIEAVGNFYTVSCVDHGVVRDCSRFDNLIDAVTDHLLTESGMG